MGRQLQYNYTQRNMNLNVVVTFLCAVACVGLTNAGRIFILDDGIDEAPLLRTRRDTGYAPAPAPSYGDHPKGRVGPVYTFVKTDPQANFKWGVRHRAGVRQFH